MSVSVSVESPRKLTKETLILVGGGAGAGIVATGLNLIAGNPVPALGALAFGGVVGLLANLTDPKAGTPMLRLVLAICGGAAMAILLFVHWALAAAAMGVFLGLSFSLEDGDNVLERSFMVGMYALALMGGVFVTRTLGPMFTGAELFGNIFVGATWGVFLAFAGGLKRIRWNRDEVMAEFKDAYAELRGDDRETIRNGRILYEQILKELERTKEPDTRDRALEIANETSRALIAITSRSQQLRVAAERTAHRQLQSRIVDLDARIQASTDATVRRELEATLEELVEQVKARKRFDVARARLEARQQRCFTALERLHVSLVQSSSGADDVAVIESIESLEKLSDELRWRNLSVDELVGDGAPDPSLTQETDDIVAEIRAELDSASEAGHAEEDESSQTVLDTGASTDDARSSDEPPGTDGSVDVAAEQQAHAGSHSR